MKEILELVKFLGITSIGSVAVVIIVGYTLRKLFETDLIKDAEKFKATLQAEATVSKLKLDKQIESFKSELSILSSAKVRLYENRLEVIATLYEKVTKLHGNILIMTHPLKLVNEDLEKEEKERISKVADAGDDFTNYYRSKKLFFEPSTCELLEELKDKFYDIYYDYTTGRRLNIEGSELEYKKVMKATEAANQEIPPILEKLEEDFRKLIGVIEK